MLDSYKVRSLTDDVRVLAVLGQSQSWELGLQVQAAHVDELEGLNWHLSVSARPMLGSDLDLAAVIFRKLDSNDSPVRPASKAKWRQLAWLLTGREQTLGSKDDQVLF